MGGTVKLIGLLVTPATETRMFPVVAPLGTGVTIVVEFQDEGVAVTPLNDIVLEPCVDPKLLPPIVTDVPTPDWTGVTLAMNGATAKFTPLLGPPATVTMTLPVVADGGTGVTMLAEFQ
jgi:hypothetical protein